MSWDSADGLCQSYPLSIVKTKHLKTASSLVEIIH